MLEAQPAIRRSLKRVSMRYSLWSLLVLIADVWAIVNIIQSSADTGKKVLWTVVVVLLPVLGFILWFFLGPRTGRA
jgi:Phospholipase_D-nuclease N-terminal